MSAPELPVAASKRLHAGLAALALPAHLASPLLAYLALLSRWNRAYNLTAIRDPLDMVTRHLLDSLSMVPHVAHLGTLADLGTGPGLPGIPLALAVPELRVTLVESNGKKARFLREVVRALQLGNAEVVHARAENVKLREAFDAITARALGTLAEILAVGGHLLAADGQLLAMKGASPTQEIADLPPRWRIKAIHPLRVPALEGARHLVVVCRESGAA